MATRAGDSARPAAGPLLPVFACLRRVIGWTRHGAAVEIRLNKALEETGAARRLVMRDHGDVIEPRIGWPGGG